MSYLALGVPRTGLEPARLAALAPETSASTIPPPGLCEYKGSDFFFRDKFFLVFFVVFLSRFLSGWDYGVR